MDAELKARLDAQDEKLDKIFKSAEKTRRYLLITAWVTILVFVLPLIGLMFVIPQFMSLYSTTLPGLLQ